MHSLCYFHVINFHDFQVATFTAKNVLANPRERVSKSYFVKRNCSQYSIDLQEAGAQLAGAEGAGLPCLFFENGKNVS